jgi:hypothetical protein
VISPKHPAHQTQWAAQFAVASELCKHGYQVSLTLGNHPKIDLMVISPKGRAFSIDVKGLHRRNPWIIKPKLPQENLYYVLTFVPEDEPNRFFILDQSTANAEVKENQDKARARKRQKGLLPGNVDNVQCIGWTAAEKFESKWNTLPDWPIQISN